MSNEDVVSSEEQRCRDAAAYEKRLETLLSVQNTLALAMEKIATAASSPPGISKEHVWLSAMCSSLQAGGNHLEAAEVADRSCQQFESRFFYR